MRLITHSLITALLVIIAATLQAQPVANFTATPLTGCAPMLVTFTNTSTGNPTSFQWTLGNSATSVLPNPTTTYTIPGTYTVTLTVSNASGTDVETKTNYITVLANPIVNFTVNDTASCPPLNAIFTNTSNPVTPGPATYNWSFGDGYLSPLQAPTHAYPYPGYYNVTLVVTNSGGCISSLTKPNLIHVYTPPVADFSAVQAQCDYPAVVPFTSTVTGTGPYVYSWDFGDGNTGTGANPSNTYTNPGTYTVQLIVTDINGCMDTMIKPAYITVGALTANFSTTPGCVNTPLQFTSTSVNATGVLWEFGDGGTAGGPTPTHVYTAPGVYNVKLKVINGTCVDSVTLPVTVNPQPDAIFSFSPLQPCPAPSTVVFTNTSTGALNYAWDFGDFGFSSNMSPTHIYNSNGFFPAKLIATSNYGCKDTLIDTVKVYDIVPFEQASKIAGCVPLEVKFGVKAQTTIPPLPPPSPLLKPYPYAISTWSWDFRDGGTSTLDTPTHIFTTPGHYWVRYTITTVNGCSLTDSIYVMAGTKPTASFTYSPDTICIHDTVHFVNTSTGLDTSTLYYWYFGEVLNSVFGFSLAKDPSYSYGIVSGGPFTVTLVVNNNGCQDTMTKDSIILVHPPTSIPKFAYDCDTPLLVRFYDTESIQPTSHLWDFGDGTTTTASNPVHIFQTLGNHTVKLITWNSIYGCTDTGFLAIHLLDPVLTFSTPDTAICRGDSILFTPVYSSTPSTTYSWTLNNQVQNLLWKLPSIYPMQDPWGHRFNQNSINTISVVVADIHDCLDTATRTNYVLVAKPTAQFAGSPPIGCAPLNVLFTEGSTNTTGAYSVTREWTFGNGNTNTVSTATTTQLYNPGTYTVQLVVTDNVGCKDTLVRTNYIESRKPGASYVPDDTTVCIGQNIQFVNYSTGVALTHAWNFGDGTTSTAASPTKAYAQTGTYTVRLIVTDPTGCKDTVIGVNQIIVSKPNASFTMSDTLAICPPLNVLFTNITSGATSYAWDFGNTAISGLQNPSAIYTDPGIFNITLIATDNAGCKDTAYGRANILGYAGGLSYTPLTGCVPLQVQFTATLNNVPTIIWDFSDGVTQPANGASTTTHTYVTPGVYIPKLILSDGAGCLNSSAGFDTIRVDAVYAGYTNSPACEKTLVQFQDTSFSFFSPVSSWYWSFNNGQDSSFINNPTHLYPTAGDYPVLLVATNGNGCKDTVKGDLHINALPKIGAGADTIICIGDAAQLTGSGGVSYIWTPATGLSCVNCSTPLASPAANLSYVVTGTDINGCQNTDTVAVKLQYITTSAVGDGGEICDDSTFQLFASGAHRYEWEPGESLSNSQIPDPVASPHATTIYVVKAWEGTCPPDSHTVKVVVYPKPVVYAGGDEKIVAGGSVVLNATGTNIATFAWSPPATLSCETCSNPTASPLRTTNYSVLASTNHGCKHSDTVTVFVICDNSQLFIPNYFSPNGDGNNDLFYPRGEGLDKVTVFKVFNRLGELMFERNNFELNDATNAWDGTYKGNQLSPDVYVYVIQGICDNGESLMWKGDITLGR